MERRSLVQSSTIEAVVGPTNTGKTHRAVERMLEHGSGMIGLPLRLLAREVYDRVSARIGERQVALVTGEEKRIPARPRYWVCTVEAMPVDRPVEFLAVDEIQLAAHPQRGHVFTDRLLRARGEKETWFLGSDTIRPLLEQLLPTAHVRRHPRFSRLSASGSVGLGGLPPRTAVIAFSAHEVYELADRLRRRRGGAAVVLGALSPRTRNAQVAMYQAGEVDFLVATDAIGMGLNMDVDHVAFASMRKFDGRRRRALAPDEVGQIAGRAGRYQRDGTFGAVSPVRLSPELTFAVESHRFAPLRRVVWRNAELDFSTAEALIGSLRRRPPRRALQLVERPDDAVALEALAGRDEIGSRLRGEERVRLLWQVCQIPDFRKLMPEHHAALLAEIYAQLADRGGTLDPDWMNQRIERLEAVDGDIDTLMMRMEFIRTWSYIAHRPGWVHDALHWQQRTEQAEDVLSQALHERLMERFVERRGAGRSRARRGRSRSRKSSHAEAGDSQPPPNNPFAKLKALKLASARPLAVELPDDDWVEGIVAAEHERFDIRTDGTIVDGDEPLARLRRGVDLLHPEIRLALPREPGAGARSRVQRRLLAYARDVVEELLEPLRGELRERLRPAARGLCYQLETQLGTVRRRDAKDQLAALVDDDRPMLQELGVRIGAQAVFHEQLLSPAMVRRRLALLAGYWDRVPRLAPDAVCTRTERGVPEQLYPFAGYLPLGGLALRVDVAEQLLGELERLAATQPFALPPTLATLVGASSDQLERVVIALGYHQSSDGFSRPRRRRRGRRRRGRRSSRGGGTDDRDGGK
jgi:ATP-dependent RNA helicase SUPV3L1/SUV3